MSMLGWVLGGAAFIGGTFSAGYMLSSAAEVSREGRFWRNQYRKRFGPEDEEEFDDPDTFDPDEEEEEEE